MTEAGRITAAIDGDVSGLSSALNKARSEATAAAAGIENDFKSKLSGGLSGLASDVGKSMQGGFGGIREGLTKSLTSGDFSSAGAGIGNQVVSGLSSSLGPIGGVAGEIATTLGPSGIIALGAVAGGAAIGAALISGISSAVQAAGQFETAMSGAKKVISVDDSSADAYFKQLGSDLQELSTQAPVSANDLAALAAVGGSLGVDSSQIAGFAESAAQMSVAFELPAEQAATSAAKILNAFQQPINTENMQSLGNVINQIGDSMAATEADVLDFTNRASFLNTTMGLSVTQVATLGGVLVSKGLSAETAAGGLKSAMNTLTSESSKTGGMDNWAKLMGVSVDELKAKVASDLPNTLIETANKIAVIEDPVQRFQTAVGLAGSEGAPALLKLAGATDTYNSALAKTIEQWDMGQNGEAGGMAKTFEQNSSTYEAAGQMLSNAMTYASVSLGNVFLPAATAATSGLTSLVVGAVQAGSSIGSLVSNSQAASAIGSAFSSIGSIGSAVFGNLSAVVTPVWDAIGGGEAVMSGLQAAFDATTSPITLVFTGISTLAGGLADLVSAAQPVASVIGSGIASAITTASSAIQTGSAYVQAFGEAISDLITNSAVAQAIGGIFDSVTTSISGVVDFVSDIGSKIVSGLTTAIPQAASGFSSAIGSLVGQAGSAASGYFEDAVKDSPLGGIFGFAESISARASEIMKTGEEAGAAVGEGILNSKELNEGLAKSADFDSPENIEAAKKAGINVGGTAGQAAGEEFSKEWVAAFEQAQADRDIAKILARSATLSSKDTDEAIRSFDYLGEQFELSIKQHTGSAAGDYFEYSLYGGDTRLDSGQAMGYADPIALFEAATGLPAPEEGSAAYYRLLGDEVAAKQVELQEELAKQTTTFDYSGISDTFSQQFADRLANEGAIIGKSGSDAAVDAYTSMLDSMRDPMLADLGSVLDEIETLSTERPLAASEYELFGDQFKDKIASQVTDAELFTKEKLADFSESATSSLSDGIIDSMETEDLLGLKPELEFMQQYFPEQFEAMGGEAALKLIAALEAGDYSGANEIIKENLAIDSTDIVDSYLDFAKNMKDEMAGIGEEIGDEFTEGLLPDTDRIQESIDNLKSLQIYDPEAAAAQGTSNAIAYLEALKEAINNYETIKAKLLAEPDNDNLRAEAENAKQVVETYWANAPAELNAKVDVDTSIFGTSMADIAGSVNLADILADPEEFKEKVMDIPDFVENTFQPALSDEIDFMVDQWDSGYGEAREQTEKFVDDLVGAARKMPNLFSNSQLTVLAKYSAGLIDAKQALEGMGWEATKTAEAVDNLRNYAQNADSGSYEADMFYGSWIGKTSDYYQWLVEYSGKPEDQIRTVLIQADCAEADRALEELDKKIAAKKTVSVAAIPDTEAAAAAGIAIGETASASAAKATDPFTVPIDTSSMDAIDSSLDKSLATADALSATITTPDTKPIEADGSKATATVSDLTKTITAIDTKPVQVDNTDALIAIAAIDAAARQSITKTVYIEYEDSGYSYSYDSGSYSDYSATSFATEGYVSSPTLAIVGDRPGGEYVVGAARFEAAAGKINAAQGITIAPIYNINGIGLSKDEIADLLAKNNKELLKEVASQIRTGKSF